MIKSMYFSEKEFRRCNPPCSLQDMDEDAITYFDRVREDAGIPLVINSAYRSPDWEKKQGRSGNSAHTRGMALDIRCTTSANRFKIVRALLDNYCTRIGVGKTFIHADFDPTLPQEVMWDYYEE